MNWTIYILIGITALIILAFVLSVIYGKEITPDATSLQRMDKIKSVMVSVLGPQWVTILFSFSLLTFIVLILLYMLSRKPEGETSPFVNTITKYMTIISTIILALILVIYSLTTIKRYYDEQSEEREYEGDTSTSTKLKTLMIIVGGVFGLLIAAAVIMFALMYLLK